MNADFAPRRWDREDDRLGHVEVYGREMPMQTITRVALKRRSAPASRSTKASSSEQVASNVSNSAFRPFEVVADNVDNK